MSFQSAVARTEALRGAYRDGLQALKRVDREKIRCANSRDLTGSVNLDEALADSHPNDPRWDYGIGVRKARGAGHVVWVEVHPATSHGAAEVCEKHSWLMKWLESSAPLLSAMTGRCVWVASGKVAIPPHSPHRRRLAAQGIHFAGRTLDL
jgi:hypothetical protein